jgi:hypothetical protein
MKCRLLCVVGAGIVYATLGVSLVPADTVNVDFNGSRGNGGGPVTYTGQGAYATADTHVWNGLYLPDLSDNGTGGGAFSGLEESNGSATSVGVGLGNSFSQNLQGSSEASGNNLLDDYLFVGAQSYSIPSMEFTISGLAADSSYSLYLYGTNGRNGDGAAFTIDSLTQSTDGAAIPVATPDGVTNPYGLGYDYVLFTGVVADSSGMITGTFSGPTGAPNGEGAFAGFQIVGDIPAAAPLPSAASGGLVLIGGFGLWMLARRRVAGA